MSTGQPPTPQHPPPGYVPYPPPSEGRPVSFYVALFLGLLLLISGAINVVLVVLAIIGSASALPSSLAEADDLNYQVVTVGGDPGARDKILRVPIVGAIAEAPSALIGAPGGTVSQVRRSLSLAQRRDDIRAVLLDINSPGGGVTDSDEIWRLLRKFKRENPDIPLVAHFGDICASGGYYIAVACDHIVSRRTTMTGSIGVIMSSYQIGEALDKIGVDPVVIKSERTPYKDILSLSRPMTEEETAMLTSIVDEMLDRFIEVVDLGRDNLSVEQVTAAATGAIYSASQALERGLVDAVGDGEDVHQWILNQAGIEAAAVIEQRRRPGLADLLLGASAPAPGRSSVEAALGTLMEQATAPRLLYFWPGAR